MTGDYYILGMEFFFMKKKYKNLIILMTYNTSLHIWKKYGIIERELLIIKSYCKYFDKVYLIDYSVKVNNDIIKKLPENLIVYNFYQESLNNFICLKNLLKYFYKIENAIIRTNQTLGSWIYIPLKLINKFKLIVRMGNESFLYTQLDNKPLKIKLFFFLNNFFSYWFSNIIFAPNDEIKKFICKNYFIKKNKIKIIPNYIKSIANYNLINTSKLNCNKFVYIGRVNEFKIQKNVLKILNKLNIELDIYGYLENKSYINPYKNINYKGIYSSDNFNKLISPYTFCILPNDIDQHPKTVLECMSIGVINITGKFFGYDEIIQNDKNGFVLESFDTKYLEKKFINILNTNYKKKLLMINNSLNYIRSYSIENIFNLEIDQLKKI